jgi:hypothetical protein
VHLGALVKLNTWRIRDSALRSVFNLEEPKNEQALKNWEARRDASSAALLPRNNMDNINEPMTPEMKARLIAIAKNKKNIPDPTPEDWEALFKKYGTVELPPTPPPMTPEEIADLKKRYPS